MEDIIRRDLIRAANAALAQTLPRDAFKWAVSQAEMSLTSVGDWELRQKLTGFESRLELAGFVATEDEAGAECRRIAREILEALGEGNASP